MKKESAQKPLILFKYGGNAMSNEKLQNQVLQNIGKLQKNGFRVIIVHGGGPFIKEGLDEAKIESEFIDGQRKTTKKAFEYVEMTLRGKVNSILVRMLNAQGYKAVGLSGQDGSFVKANKRLHETLVDNKKVPVDLGQVGDIVSVDPSLLELLIENQYLPVVSCIAADENGDGFNINGDLFAGHLAGALKVDQYVVLTDVDGLMHDKDLPDSLIKELTLNETKELIDNGTIQGGMIPKIEACEVALLEGAKSAYIINGTKPELLNTIAEGKIVGTHLKK
jgi:acetylglutamate kinase